MNIHPHISVISAINILCTVRMLEKFDNYRCETSSPLFHSESANAISLSNNYEPFSLLRIRKFLVFVTCLMECRLLLHSMKKETHALLLYNLNTWLNICE